MSERQILVIGSQCEAIKPPLPFLPGVAHDLFRVMTDPEIGGCSASSAAGGLLIDPTAGEAEKAIEEAFAAASSVEAPVRRRCSPRRSGSPVPGSRPAGRSPRPGRPRPAGDGQGAGGAVPPEPGRVPVPLDQLGVRHRRARAAPRVGGGDPRAGARRGPRSDRSRAPLCRGPGSGASLGDRRVRAVARVLSQRDSAIPAENLRRWASWVQRFEEARVPSTPTPS